MRPIDGDELIAWIKESQRMTSKMKNVICKIETMPSIDIPSATEIVSAYHEGVRKGIAEVRGLDRPKGVYDSIALVNKETEREDLSDEIREYLFCDLRKKLWGLDSRPQAEWRDLDGNFVPLDEDGCTTASAWCSNCGEWLTGSDEYWTSGRFCPNCGYQMRKE